MVLEEASYAHYCTISTSRIKQALRARRSWAAVVRREGLWGLDTRERGGAQRTAIEGGPVRNGRLWREGLMIGKRRGVQQTDVDREPVRNGQHR